jgi:phytoene dehydrogenase-like protein
MENKKVIIIGGGVAGLTAGIYARLNGFETEIVEMHSVTGGQCTAWDRKGYRFDYCLHWLVGTRSGAFHEIWRETNVLNKDVQIIDHEIHTKVFAGDGREFIIYTDLNKWEEYLCNLAPEDVKQIRKMCADLRKSTFLKPLSDPRGLRKFWKTLPSMFSMLPIMVLFVKYGRKGCDEYFRSLGFTNESLKFFLHSIYGSRDFSALAFLMMFAWFNQKNAGYLVGGSLPMARRLTDRFLSLGGHLKKGEKVIRIKVENDTAKGIILADGTELEADYVISAADGHSTLFDMLQGKYLTKKLKDAYSNWKLFTPLIQVSFGISRKIESDTPVETWISRDVKIGRTRVEYGYSIMNYGFDATMAPQGKSVIVMRFDSPWENWDHMDPVEYKQEKKQIEKDATALLENRYPGISESIEICDVATPVTDVRYTGVWKGSYEGFMPSSRNMMANLSPVIPGLSKFYMAGQWLFPGGGLPPSAQSGKWAVQFICKEEKRTFTGS